MKNLQIALACLITSGLMSQNVQACTPDQVRALGQEANTFFKSDQMKSNASPSIPGNAINVFIYTLLGDLSVQQKGLLGGKYASKNNVEITAGSKHFSLFQNCKVNPDLQNTLIALIKEVKKSNTEVSPMTVQINETSISTHLPTSVSDDTVHGLFSLLDQEPECRNKRTQDEILFQDYRKKGGSVLAYFQAGDDSAKPKLLGDFGNCKSPDSKHFITVVDPKTKLCTVYLKTSSGVQGFIIPSFQPVLKNADLEPQLSLTERREYAAQEKSWKIPEKILTGDETDTNLTSRPLTPEEKQKAIQEHENALKRMQNALVLAEKQDALLPFLSLSESKSSQTKENQFSNSKAYTTVPNTEIFSMLGRRADAAVRYCFDRNTFSSKAFAENFINSVKSCLKDLKVTNEMKNERPYLRSQALIKARSFSEFCEERARTEQKENEDNTIRTIPSTLPVLPGN